MAYGSPCSRGPSRSARPRAIATLFIFAAGLTVAAEQHTLFRSVLPSGEVVDSELPAPGAKRAEKVAVEPYPPDPPATQKGEWELTAVRKGLLRDADAHAARRQQLDNDIADASVRLQDAQARREQGRAVREGDRQGRRLIAPFWQRQQSLETDVQRARQALNALTKEISVLHR